MSAGTVIFVEEAVAGSELTIDTSAGATSITVVDPTDFQPEGGELIIGTQEVGYSSVDEVSGAIGLDAALASSALAGDKVVALPESTERFAHVQLEDQDEVLVARVPHGLYDRLPVGARDENVDGAELAELGRAPDGELIVADVLNREPVVDGSYIDPFSLPPPATSDGSAPSASPTPSLLGGVNSLFASWTPITNADPVTYEVHLGTSSSFTPSPSTYVGEVRGTLFVIRNLPGTLTPPAYGTDYFVKTVAKDADGSAPASSASAAGQPQQITGPDIVAAGITADRLLANSALFELMQALLVVTNTLRTANDGARVEIDTAGIRLISSTEEVLVDMPTDPALSPTFRGDVITGGLLVLGNMLIQGADNSMDEGSALTLLKSVATPSTAPSLAIDTETLQLGSFPAATPPGLYYDSAGGAGGATPTFWVPTASTTGTAAKAYECTAAGGALNRTLTDTFDGTIVGVARLGTDLFLLVRRSNTWFLRKYVRSTLAFTSETEITSSLTVPSIPHGLGADGTNLLVAGLTSASGTTAQVKIYKFSGTPAFVSSTTTTGHNYVPNLNSDQVTGITVQGGNYWVSGTGTGGFFTGSVAASVQPYSTSTGAYVADQAFPIGNTGGAVGGVAHDGTRFWTGRGNSTLNKHSLWDWTTESTLYWVGYTWRNSVSGFETPVSPRASITMSRRRRLSITLPAFPNGVDSARIFVQRSATAPATTALHRQAPTTYIDQETSSPILEVNFDAAGAAPPTTNTFGGSPSAIKSANVGTTAPAELRGDGKVILARVTTAQRDALGAPEPGVVVFNDDTDGAELYDGAAWTGLASGAYVYTGAAFQKGGSTTVERTLLETANNLPTLVGPIVANVVGAVYRITLSGNYDQAVAGGTLTVRLKIGTTAIETYTFGAPGVAIAAAGFVFDGTLVVKTAGASGKVSARTSRFLNNAGTPYLSRGSGDTTVNLTSAGRLDLTAQYSASSAANGVTVDTVVIERIA